MTFGPPQKIPNLELRRERGLHQPRAGCLGGERDHVLARRVSADIPEDDVSPRSDNMGNYPSKFNMATRGLCDFAYVALKIPDAM